MPNKPSIHPADDAADIQDVLDETFGTLPGLRIPGRSEWTRDASEVSGPRDLTDRQPDRG
jgi:hypothetical protein